MNPKNQPPTLKQLFAKNLFAGLSILIPLYFTFYILHAIIISFDSLTEYLPTHLRPSFEFPGVGVLSVVVLALTIGMVARNYFGGLIFRTLNRLVEKIPVVASVYGLFRQIAEVFFSEDRKSFNRVVLVEWPKKGFWSLAFVTSNTSPMLSSALSGETSKDEPWINIFVPTTPNPTAGFYFIVPESETKATNISIEDAFKIIVSLGTVR